MNTLLTKIALVLILLASTLEVTAWDWDAGVSLKAGTTGIGMDATVALSERVNLRAGISGLSVTFDVDDEDEPDNNLSMKLRLLNVPLLVDWHPAASNFRVSGGFMINRNAFNIQAETGDSIEFNDVRYEVDRYKVDIGFNSFVPYLGIGYGNAARRGKRLVFALDFGFFYHGSPKLSASARASNAALQDRLNEDLNREVKDMEDDISSFQIYPVLTMGLSYRF